jgi:hypothetical protein
MSDSIKSSASTLEKGDNALLSTLKPFTHDELIDKLYGLNSIVELAIFAIDSENGIRSSRYALTLLDSKLCDLANHYEELASEDQALTDECLRLHSLLSLLPPLGKRIHNDQLTALVGKDKKQIKTANKLVKEYKQFCAFRKKNKKSGGAN